MHEPEEVFFLSNGRVAFEHAWIVLKDSYEDNQQGRDEHNEQMKIEQERQEAAKEAANAQQMEWLTAIPCPTCGADVGVPCTNPRLGYQVHLQRMTAATKQKYGM
jgi:hypothetical protein